MTTTDDAKFPPMEAPASAEKTPLDLSLLARVTSPPETPTEPQARQKPRDRPPRSGRQTPRAKAPTPGTDVRTDDEKIADYRPGILVKPLRDMYVTVGTLVLPFNKPVGTAFIQNAEPCAKALDNAAKADKQIRRMLMLLVQGSVWGEVIIAHMPIMMALAVTLVPSVRATMNGVQSEGVSSETINPVSNGYVR